MPRSFLRTACSYLWIIMFPFTSALEARENQPVNSITAAGLRDRIFFLASDSLGGRHVGSRGFEIASLYAEGQMRAAGLVPIIEEGGESTYLQTVPMLRRTATDEPEMIVKTPKTEYSFAHGKDFKLFIGDLVPAEHKQLQIVFAGYGICEPKYGWDDFRNLDVENKAVIILMGAPTRDGKPVLPEKIHDRYAPAGGILKKLYPMIARRAAAVLLLPNEELMAAWEALPPMTRSPHLAYGNRNSGALHAGCVIPIKPEVASALFAGQGRVPPGLGLPGTQTTEGFDLENVSLAFKASFADEKIATWNIIGAVEGTDPALRNEYVAVTAHLDTKAPEKPGEIFNGADDDASGSAAVMEIARAVAMRPPGRSVVFVLFTAEEGGVTGSRHFLSNCPISLNRIVADVNLDMIGRTAPESEADRGHYALDSEKIAPAFTQLIRDVNERSIRWPLTYEYRMGDGDHLIFNAMGIPAVNFYSGHHADVNETTDDAEKIDYEKAQQISRLAYEVVMELGNRKTLWK